MTAPKYDLVTTNNTFFFEWMFSHSVGKRPFPSQKGLVNNLWNSHVVKIYKLKLDFMCSSQFHLNVYLYLVHYIKSCPGLHQIPHLRCPKDLECLVAAVCALH